MRCKQIQANSNSTYASLRQIIAAVYCIILYSLFLSMPSACRTCKASKNRDCAKMVLICKLSRTRCYFGSFVVPRLCSGVFRILILRVPSVNRIFLLRLLTADAISLFLNITGAIAPVAPVLNTPL